MNPHAGWYPDPDDAELERYWDGRAWSSNTRRPGDRLPPPPGAELPAALLAAPPAAPVVPVAPLDAAAEHHAPHLHAPHLHAPHLHAPHLHAPHLHAPHLHAPHLHGAPPGAEPTGAAWAPSPAVPAFPATPAFPAGPAFPAAVPGAVPGGAGAVRPHVPYSSFDDRTRRAYGATPRSAWAAAILGLQSGPALLYGLIGLLFGAITSTMTPYDQAEMARAGVPSDGITIGGFIVLVMGIGMFASAVGVALHRGWARMLAVVIEGLAVILGFVASIAAESAWPLVTMSAVPVVVILLIVSER